MTWQNYHGYKHNTDTDTNRDGDINGQGWGHKTERDTNGQGHKRTGTRTQNRQEQGHKQTGTGTQTDRNRDTNG